MADYKVVKGDEEAADEIRRLEKVETVESKSQISISDLKDRYTQIQSEIARLTEEANRIRVELEAISTSKVVKVAEIPGAITVSVAPPAPPKEKP